MRMFWLGLMTLEWLRATCVVFTTGDRTEVLSPSLAIWCGLTTASKTGICVFFCFLIAAKLYLINYSVMMFFPPELTQNAFSAGAKNQGWFFEIR